MARGKDRTVKCLLSLVARGKDRTVKCLLSLVAREKTAP